MWRVSEKDITCVWERERERGSERDTESVRKKTWVLEKCEEGREVKENVKRMSEWKPDRESVINKNWEWVEKMWRRRVIHKVWEKKTLRKWDKNVKEGELEKRIEKVSEKVITFVCEIERKRTRDKENLCVIKMWRRRDAKEVKCE